MGSGAEHEFERETEHPWGGAEAERSSIVIPIRSHPIPRSVPLHPISNLPAEAGEIAHTPAREDLPNPTGRPGILESLFFFPA